MTLLEIIARALYTEEEGGPPYGEHNGPDGDGEMGRETYLHWVRCESRARAIIEALEKEGRL